MIKACILLLVLGYSFAQGSLPVFVFIYFLYLHFNYTKYIQSGCGTFEPPTVPPINNTDVELQQVSIVFRHGDRIMYQDVTCWPNDTAGKN